MNQQIDELKTENGKRYDKKYLLVAVLVLAALLSATLVAGYASSPESHTGVINGLDRKKMSVLELTAATTATSVAISLLPGDIATGFTDARQKDECADSVYSGRVLRSVKTMEKDEREGMSAEKAGSYIAKLAMKKRTRPLKAIGFSYKAVAVLAKLLPRRLSNYIVGKIYAK